MNAKRRRVVTVRSREEKSTPTNSETSTASESAPELDTVPSGDSVQNAAEILASRLREKLGAAESDGLVSDVEIKTAGKRSSATKTVTPAQPDILAGMDLTLLSSMIWDVVAGWRGYDAAGMPIDQTSKKRWAEAASPVVEKLLGDLAKDHHAEITLVIVTLLIVAPRERVVYVRKRMRASVDTEPAFTEA